MIKYPEGVFKPGDRVIVSHDGCESPIGTVPFGSAKGWDVIVLSDGEKEPHLWPVECVQHLDLE